MTIYNFYMFNKNGLCIAYKEWKREKSSSMSKDEEFKLVYGMLLSLRSFSAKLSTKGGQQMVETYKTSTYKMNYLETATALKLVLNTDPDAVGVHQLLQRIYHVYVQTVQKNPLVDTEAEIESELFHQRVDEVVRGHMCYT